ncbi:MAG: glutaredoxin [Saprospirales bacterium]|nr:glutaredoxin [Saprospirales bacterium]|tara:strand:- start:1423 stop:1674 length:252 start_codon:yes stop_codon:yes gene_type:complete
MITIWGKPACPSCLKAKAMCESHQFKFEYKELGKDFTREEVFETFPNAKTFPQIIVGGVKVGGYEQFLSYVEDTNYTGTGHTL